MLFTNNIDISNALGVQIYDNSVMNSKISQWLNMYSNSAEWLNSRTVSLNLPSSIAAEFSRLVLAEFSCSVNDGYINSQFSRFISQLSNTVEFACALGGVVLKPYISNGEIFTDIVKPSDFFPVAFDSNTITAAVFPEIAVTGNDYFTRLEYHYFNTASHTYSVQNLCFHSKNSHTLGEQCSLDSVPKWAGLLKYSFFENVNQPLFSYFKMPFANNIDINSPLGISVFARADELIRQADMHWERIMWEFESSERAIDAAEDIFRMKNGKPELPKGRERMFRTYSIGIDESRPFIETFSPAIRDSSLFNGLNGILRRIEFNCGLEYGTISDISSVQKTAEEIKASRLRSYDTVVCIQQNLHNSLEQLVYCYGFYASVFGLSDCIPDSSMLTCTFGDGVKEDIDKEYQRRLQMVQCGLLSKEKFISWYFGCPENEAVTYINHNTNL